MAIIIDHTTWGEIEWFFGAVETSGLTPIEYVAVVEVCGFYGWLVQRRGMACG